jgi:cation diffusion facilitator family transporter
MHHHSMETWQHGHVFLGASHDRHERRTWLVVGLTVVTMVVEIIAGTVYGSMALTADGWHMSTHAAALSIAALAYRFARKHADDPRFSFGTGKLGELAAFASAIILGLIALLICYESLIRLFAPVSIRFDEAFLVAMLGLAVNLASAWLLWGDDGHAHGHEHGHGVHAHDDHDHSGHDHAGHTHDHQAADSHAHKAHADQDNNMRAAFVHVATDALTSVLAIAALLGGSLYGWTWLDAAVGILGAVVIAWWSYGLIVSAGATLLDIVPDTALAARIRAALEIDDDRVGDLHLWRLGPGHAGVIVLMVSDHPKPADTYKRRLAAIEGLSHVTVEVQKCLNHAA